MNLPNSTYSPTSLSAVTIGTVHKSITGKELDEETGYSYFGARYYDPAVLTAWLSVEPMSDKYPSISPYAYCAWNPLKLVDPEGEDWYEKTVENGAKTIEWCKDKASCPSDGRYLGLTYHDKANSTYYSLYGQSGIKYDPKDRYQVEGMTKIIQADRAVISVVKGINGARSFWEKHDKMINMCSNMGEAMSKLTKFKPLDKILSPINRFTEVNSFLDYSNAIKNDSWDKSTTISLASDIVSFVPLYGNIISSYLNGVNYAAQKGSEIESCLRSYFSPISPNNFFKSQYGY